MSYCYAILIAFLLDRFIGWPDWIYQRLSHPVVWVGKSISILDQRLNVPDYADQKKRTFGVMMLAVILAGFGGISFLIAILLPDNLWGILLAALLIWPFLASKSLYDHVLAVAKPLSSNDLKAARKAVSMIVGRDPDKMNSHDISRAALESLAENTSDGVIAPLFWGLFLGLPGVVLYKTINTADSMVGYKNDAYKHFGWASARLDDVVNFIPARLTGLLYAALAPDRQAAFQIMRRDASKHRSPNAGWPESAFAASLGIRLSGPRLYEGTLTSDPWLNEDGREPTARDIAVGLSRFNALLLAVVALIAAFCLLSY